MGLWVVIVSYLDCHSERVVFETKDEAQNYANKQVKSAISCKDSIVCGVDIAEITTAITIRRG